MYTDNRFSPYTMPFVTELSFLIYYCSLGAEHDGQGNTCSANDGFIMAPSVGLSYSDFDFNRNTYIFSSCSQDYFEDYIDELNR